MATQAMSVMMLRAWVHGRCYAVGLKIVALRNTEPMRVLIAQRRWVRGDRSTPPTSVPQLEVGADWEPALREIRDLLLSARPPGTITWGDEEDWAADHD